MSGPPERRIRTVPIEAEAMVPGGRTNAYVVGDTDAVLIDPAGRNDELDSAVASRDVAHVAVTHTHPDHVGAVADYAADLDAALWGRQGRESQFEAATGVAPDRTFREGTRVGPTTVLETPGHAVDHVSFVVGTEAVVGDVVLASGSVVIAGSGDMRAYLTTLRRLRQRGFSRLYPGHGPVVEEPTETVDRLIAHRLDREALVREAVRNGASDAPAVVDAVYDKDLGDAAPLAELTVRAHLRKLAVEGGVEWDGQRASPP